MRPAPALALLLALAAPAASAVDPLTAAAREHLVRALGAGYDSVVIEPVAGRGLPPLPGDDVTLETRSCGSDAPARRMCVRVDVLVRGARRNSLALWFRVEARRKVLVAQDAVPSGAAYDPGAFALELRDVAALRGAPFSPALRPGALRVRRPLERGEVLLARDVAPMPAVARNQDVMIRLQAGGILVETPGVALGEGGLGALVRVRNPRSGEIYQARVVDDGVLAVTY